MNFHHDTLCLNKRNFGEKCAVQAELLGPTQESLLSGCYSIWVLALQFKKQPAQRTKGFQGNNKGCNSYEPWPQDWRLHYKILWGVNTNKLHIQIKVLMLNQLSGRIRCDCQTWCYRACNPSSLEVEAWGSGVPIWLWWNCKFGTSLDYRRPWLKHTQNIQKGKKKKKKSDYLCTILFKIYLLLVNDVIFFLQCF